MLLVSCQCSYCCIKLFHRIFSIASLHNLRAPTLPDIIIGAVLFHPNSPYSWFCKNCYISWMCILQEHTLIDLWQSQSVSSTSCDIFPCKVLSCCVKRFMRRCIYKHKYVRTNRRWYVTYIPCSKEKSGYNICFDLTFISTSSLWL